MSKLVKLNEQTYVNTDCVILVAFNAQTLKTGVFLSNGAVVESNKTFDETAKMINEKEA